VLALADLAIEYGGVRAVHGVSLEVSAGEAVALVGPNGAGKSSIMMAICGVVRPARGQIAFLGERIDRLPSHEIVQRGIVQVPEARLIFSAMTVGDNLLMGAYARRDTSAIRQDLSRVLDLFPALRGRLRNRAGTLSGGELQMLALGRGLMARPRLLLLDEPTLGLAPLVAREIFERLSGLHADGTTILLVEQNLRQALAFADRAYFLESGRVVAEGESRTLLRSERVVRAYLGAAAARET